MVRNAKRLEAGGAAPIWPRLEPPAAPGFDETELAIVGLLREDPQVSNRTVAAKLGLAESTVAARLKALFESNRIRVTLQRDIEAQGARIIAHLDIFVELRPASEVCAEIARAPEISSVVRLMGAPQIIAQAQATDEDDLVRIIDERIAPIAGVARVESAVSLRVLKYGHGLARLADSPVVITDPLDEAIIARLRTDGRTSNRQIGRELGVSEGTIRKRLKRLQDLNSIRLSLVVDSVAAGYAASAYVRLSVTPREAPAVGAFVAGLDACGYAAFTAGRYNVLCFILAPDRAHLMTIVDNQIAPLPGIRELDVREVAETVQHRFDTIRIV